MYKNDRIVIYGKGDSYEEELRDHYYNLVTDTGVKPNPSKSNYEHMNMPRPMDKKDAQRFSPR